MPSLGWHGLAMVVAGRRGDGSAPGAWFDGRLLTERRILSARQGRDYILRSAEPLLHGLDIFSAEQFRALQAAEGVQIVAVDDVFGWLLAAIVEVIPYAHEFPAIGLVQNRIDMGNANALGKIRAPNWDGLVAAHPSRRPHVLRKVIVKSGEEGCRLTFMAVVVESAQLSRSAVGKEHPIEQAEVSALDERREAVVGQREGPHGEGLIGGKRLRSSAQRGDDQRRIA